MTIDQKFDVYYNLLVEWNNKFNLTSITERDKVDLLHFKDSIIIKDFIGKGSKLLDVGSGAGFPGVPLKIVREDLNVTLLDSVNKKVTFLNELISKLELTGIEAIHKRIEDLDKTQKFDVVTSRAVAPLNVLCEYCLPFVKQDGIMIAYKSADIDKELDEAKNAIGLLGGKVDQIKEIALNDEITRKFIIIKKIKESPSSYPRGGNKPRLKPIL